MSLFIDGLAFLYMLFNGILGYSRGLVDELGRLIGLVLSIIIATGQTVNISKIILEKIHLARQKKLKICLEDKILS